MKPVWCPDSYVNTLRNYSQIVNFYDDYIKFTYENTNFIFTAKDEIEIFFEVFLKHGYRIDTKKELVVFDIGMNVGIASLYFANLSNVVKVYGFEPFEQAYNCALNNFNSNPHLLKKIHPYKFGLGLNDGEVYGATDTVYKGNSSTVRGCVAPEQYLEKVCIKRASTIINPIINENPNLDIFIKMDCEGAEVEIFKDKDFIDTLDKIYGIVMETHTPEIFDEITLILKNKNFKVNNKMLSASNGYIYAIK